MGGKKVCYEFKERESVCVCVCVWNEQSKAGAR